MSLTFDDIDQITQQLIEEGHTLLSIAGPSASGKSYFAKQLQAKLEAAGKSVLAISSDNYYLNNTPLYAMIYGTYDHPHLIHFDRLNEDLHTYLQTGQVDIPIYSFSEKRTVGYTHVEETYDIVIVEGIYTISQLDPALKAYNIFVTSPAEELVIRRLTRDVERVQEPLYMIVNNIENVFPMRHLYGQQQADMADMTVINAYNILDIKGTHWKVHREQPASLPELTDTIYAVDHIYFDKSEGQYPDQILISESYSDAAHTELKYIQVKNIMPAESGIKSLTFTFYQPGIITTLHSLFQLAGMQAHKSIPVEKRLYGESYFELVYPDGNHERLHNDTNE